MNYAQSIDYLFSLKRFGIRPGLENITALLKELGNPHEKLKCIHVAGTNGKGSTSAFLFSILNNSGHNTGLYTSPHLIDFTERIALRDRYITRKETVSYVNKIMRICTLNGFNKITFFEFTTAMAFLFFADRQADPVIIETGLGGTYDATNVIKPILSIITSIGIEHKKILGGSLVKIAEQKAGIIKKGIPVVCGAKQNRVIEKIRSISEISESAFYQLGRDFSVRKLSAGVFAYKGFDGKTLRLISGLKGDHQFRNAAVAAAGANLLHQQGYAIDEKHIIKGTSDTLWHGRLETLSTDPLIVVDGAHNPDGWKALKKALNDYFSYNRIIFVIGILKDKDIKRLYSILVKDAFSAVFCKPDIDRAADKLFIQKHVVFSSKKRIYWEDNSFKAIEKAKKIAGIDDMICVTGSIFIAGEIKQYLNGQINAENMRVAM